MPACNAGRAANPAVPLHFASLFPSRLTQAKPTDLLLSEAWSRREGKNENDGKFASAFKSNGVCIYRGGQRAILPLRNYGSQTPSPISMGSPQPTMAARSGGEISAFGVKMRTPPPRAPYYAACTKRQAGLVGVRCFVGRAAVKAKRGARGPLPSSGSEAGHWSSRRSTDPDGLHLGARRRQRPVASRAPSSGPAMLCSVLAECCVGPPSGCWPREHLSRLECHRGWVRRYGPTDGCCHRREAVLLLDVQNLLLKSVRVIWLLERVNMH